jgi:hypothetical protein
MTTLDTTLLTAANIVESFTGREYSGAAELRAAANLLDAKAQRRWQDQGEAMGLSVEGIEALLRGPVRDRIAADALTLGKTKDEIDAFLGRAQATSSAAPAKRTRTAKARPEAPADDAALLELLLEAIGDDRVGHKGLAAKFAGLDIDRVRRVLADEASRGAAARVKLEPNGRTWVRVKP